MIFFHQKMPNWYLGNYEKKRKKNLYLFEQEAQKNETLDPSGPPLMHLSVKKQTVPLTLVLLRHFL